MALGNWGYFGDKLLYRNDKKMKIECKVLAFKCSDRGNLENVNGRILDVRLGFGDVGVGVKVSLLKQLYFMGRERLELSRFSSPHFECGASTDFAIRPGNWSLLV